MKRLVQKSLLQYVVRHRNGYLALATGLLFLNILLVIVIISLLGNEKIILVPPKLNQSFWVNNSEVSPEYLAEMSYFFSNLRFNSTPSIASNQREVILKYVDPKYYEALKATLINEEERISKSHITTAFYPVDVKVNVHNLQTLVTGDLVPTVGTNQLAAVRITYRLSFDYHSGRLLVKSFEEVKNHV